MPNSLVAISLANKTYCLLPEYTLSYLSMQDTRLRYYTILRERHDFMGPLELTTIRQLVNAHRIQTHDIWKNLSAILDN